GISGAVEVSRAAETTGTALRALTRSSAVAAPRTEEHLVFLVNCLGKLPKVREASRRISQIQNITGARSSPAHGARQRFQGSVSGVSGPSLRSGPVLFEVARAQRSLLLLCHPEIPRKTQIWNDVRQE